MKLAKNIKRKKQNKELGLALEELEENEDIEEIDLDIEDPKNKPDENKNSGSNSLEK